MSVLRTPFPRQDNSRFNSSADMREFVLSEESVRKLEKEQLNQARRSRDPKRYRDTLNTIAAAREAREARAKANQSQFLAQKSSSPATVVSEPARRKSSITWVVTAAKEELSTQQGDRANFSGGLATPISENEAFTSSSDEDHEQEEWTTEVTGEVQERVDALPDQQKSASLEGLPTELQLQIFGYLDKIDSVCLGLTSPHHYGILRALHPEKMPLNSRRVGQAGTVERSWEIVGRNTCNHCGTYRCQLWRHIKDWMPDYLEYCTLKENFGMKAGPEARETCYRSKPSKPRRCGRHPIRTTTVHQDDISFSTTISPLTPLSPLSP